MNRLSCFRFGEPSVIPCQQLTLLLPCPQSGCILMNQFLSYPEKGVSGSCGSHRHDGRALAVAAASSFTHEFRNRRRRDPSLPD